MEKLTSYSFCRTSRLGEYFKDVLLLCVKVAKDKMNLFLSGPDGNFLISCTKETCTQSSSFPNELNFIQVVKGPRTQRKSKIKFAWTFKRAQCLWKIVKSSKLGSSWGIKTSWKEMLFLLCSSPCSLKIRNKSDLNSNTKWRKSLAPTWKITNDTRPCPLEGRKSVLGTVDRLIRRCDL